MNNSKDFLKTLKAGDYVFVDKTLTKVHHITPTGIIVVDGIKYDPKTGYSKGGDGWNFSFLNEATEDKIKEYNQEKFKKDVLRKLTNEFNTITYEQCVEISKICGWVKI